MNKKALLLLALIVLISGAISFSLLSRGQSWLDDFAQYILQARSILGLNMGEFIRENTFTVSNSSYPPGPVAYPWGFPLMLAPVYALFGLNTLAMQLLNTLSYSAFLVIFFALACTRLPANRALLLTAVLGFNPALLTAHQQIISDIPFLFVSTLGIFLIERLVRQKAPLWTGLAAGAVIFLASFLRTNGALLLVPLLLAQVLATRGEQSQGIAAARRWTARLIPYLTFGCLYVLQALIFPNGESSYVGHFSMFSLQGLWDNFVFYLWLPAATFSGLPLSVVLYPFLLVFVAISAIRFGKRDLAMIGYCLATVLAFIIWPERQGLRFLYPVLPFLFIFAFCGMEQAITWLKTTWQKPAALVASGFWVLLALSSLWISVDKGRANLADNRTITGPFDPVSAEMFNFLRAETPPDSVIVFFKPRAMHLMSGRNSFITDNCDQLAKGNYLALSKKAELNGLIPLQELSSCDNVTLKRVFENRRFVVYGIGQ